MHKAGSGSETEADPSQQCNCKALPDGDRIKRGHMQDAARQHTQMCPQPGRNTSSGCTVNTGISQEQMPSDRQILQCCSNGVATRMWQCCAKYAFSLLNLVCYVVKWLLAACMITTWLCSLLQG